MDRRNIEDIYKLSPIQQGMLFHSVYTPGSSVYFEQFAWTIPWSLDADLFGKAWQTVIDQNPILRTAFFWENVAEPMQVVQRQTTLEFRAEDWRDVPEVEIEARLDEFRRLDRERGFDLRRAPLMRVATIALPSGGSEVVWSYHHLLLDGWSVPLVIQDVFTAYSFMTRHVKPVLPQRRSYRDYMAWLRQRDLDAARGFWRAQLHDVSAATPLPLDRAPGVVLATDDQFTTQEVALSSDLTDRLQALARAERVTLNTLVQSAWALLLSRYSGQREVVYGTTVSGRPADLTGSDQMIGVFINTLPVRVAIDPAATIRAWFAPIQETLVTLREYEYSPLIDVQAASGVQRGAALFESIVVFENFPLQQDADMASIRIFQKTNYPLTLTAYPTPVLTLKFSYDRRRFDDDGIARLLRQLETVLEQFAADPDRPVGAIELLTEAERAQIVRGWNATERAYDVDQPLHALVAAQTGRTPDAIAVVFEDQRLSYHDLDERANQLAHYLQSLGVGPETRVAVCMDRSLDLVISLLAVLKAGGAYVPIDPSYPADRLRFMLQDVRSPVVLTRQWLLAELPLDPGAIQIVAVDARWKEIAQQPAAAPHSRVHGDSAAYMIYTSGSTGQPKGAINTHAAIVNRLLWMQDEYGLTADDSVLQKTPFSFDVSVWEFFWPLITGARLVVAKPGGHQDPAYLVQTIRQAGITTLHFVPSMLRIFLEQAGVEGCHTIRRVICSGEALTSDLQQRFFERIAMADLHNLYGPTEAAVDVSYWACQRDGDERSVPIGWPVANTQLYIVDEQMRPVPIGAPGELLIGGVQLARGYHDRPGLTAEKFVPNPFATDDGSRTMDHDPASARLYRTGDLARFRADGAIEYLGRLDFQVKVRGNRIELGEIEAALAEQPGVRDSVVVAREDTPGDVRIVAYLVAGADRPTVESLRGALQARLPQYMVPSAFVVLDALPLSPNGKLDRRALPKPDQSDAERKVYIAPRTDTERAIAEVWQTVLGVEQVGLNDNFFDLGGHSLLMMQVHGRLREALGTEIPMLDLFRYTTVGALAKYVSGGDDPGSFARSSDRSEQVAAGKDRRRQLLERRQRG